LATTISKGATWNSPSPASASSSHAERGHSSTQYYLKNLHSEGNMLQERIARKFHQLHTKQVNAQFGHMKL